MEGNRVNQRETTSVSDKSRLHSSAHEKAKGKRKVVKSPRCANYRPTNVGRVAKKKPPRHRAAQALLSSCWLFLSSGSHGINEGEAVGGAVAGSIIPPTLNCE